MTDFFFVAFALVFFATRLIVFPFHVFKYSVRAWRALGALLFWHSKHRLLPHVTHQLTIVSQHNTQVQTPRKHLGYDYLGVNILNFFLFVLICLHVYWMAIIVRMAVKMAMTGKAEKDGRSDDEEDYEASDGEKED